MHSSRDAVVSSVLFENGLIVVSLSDGRIISAPLAWFPKLLEAADDLRKQWVICASGRGIHWPMIDEDISIDGLLFGQPSSLLKRDHHPFN